MGYFIFFREYVKSLEDAGGDGAAGYRSLAVGRWVRRRSGVLLALPLLAGGILATARGPLATWNQLAGGGFVLCLLAAVVSLPYSRWRRGHAAGTLLKAGAFCGLGLLWGMTA